MSKITNKKVNLNLIGLDGNAFALLGAFSKQAREDGWTPEEIKAVRDEATSGDHSHLLCTLMDYCEAQDEEDDLENEYWSDNEA